MNLAVFDIDGTLTATNEVDDVCFVQALADAHGITDINTDWASYPHTTDSAIISHIYQQRFSREPETLEIDEIKRCFVRLLKENRQKRPALFDEITGAASMLTQLKQEPDWRIAIASGSWGVAAELKLEEAKIETDQIVTAYADDGFSREEILRSAISKGRCEFREQSFDRIVSIGDGVWDLRTARNLSLPFIGIGDADRADRLRQQGATHVLKDFVPYPQVLRCLVEAEVPADGKSY